MAPFAANFEDIPARIHFDFRREITHSLGHATHSALTRLAKRDGFSGGDDSDSGSSDSGSGSGSDSSDSGSSSDSSSSSSTNSSSGSGADGNTLSIVLGVVIPVSVALILIVFLWRRQVRRQKLEDANDKHGSLDFGMGNVSRPKSRKGKKGQPEMTVAEVDLEKKLRGQGQSMDMSSPFFFPDDTKKMRPSFESPVMDREDPYRSISTNEKSPAPPSYSSKLDTASIYSGKIDDNSKTNLVHSASKFSKTSGPGRSSSSTRSSSPSERSPIPIPESSHSSNIARKPVGLRHRGNSTSSGSLSNQAIPEETAAALATADTSTLPATNFSLPKIEDDVPTGVHGPTSPPTDQAENPLNEWETYADVLGIVQKGPNAEALPVLNEPAAPANGLMAPSNTYLDAQRLSTNIRPLPPDDPSDNAEQRANRIRSFYREYFDDSKPGPAAAAAPAEYDHGYGDYYEDYGQEYLSEAPIFDPETGEFVIAGGAAPYAQAIGRRAMTPPPRGPRGFRGPHSAASSANYGYGSRRARAYSTASARMAGPRGRPVKKLPPPKALHTLPTPHLLRKENADESLLDFAPPPSMRDLARGRPQSPKGESRPYSPSVRAHTPLKSTNNELTSMPSPHLLRKSSTFTGLDFAPPPRFGPSETGSDSGSIRSGRTGITREGRYNIRAGAYRLSRLPKATVGTKNDLAATLKPQWDIGRA